MKKFLNQLKSIHTTLAAGQFLFTLVLYLMHLNSATSSTTDKNLLTAMVIAVSILTVIALVMSYVLFRIKLKSAKTKETLNDKLEEYRLASLLRWTLLQFPAFFISVAYFMTGFIPFLVLAGCIFLLFVYVKPGAEKIKQELGLDSVEMFHTDFLL